MNCNLLIIFLDITKKKEMISTNEELEFTYKGCIAYISMYEITNTHVGLNVVTRTGETTFDIYNDVLDREDFELNDILYLDLSEIHDYLLKEVVSDFMKDIIKSDFDNYKKYNIEVNKEIKLYFDGKIKATGEQEIEDYISMINR